LTTAEEVAADFETLYGARPELYRAPGRVNLIGEHTDYNDGFVMPAAIGFSTYVAIAARDDRRVVLRSGQFSESAELDLDCLPASRICYRERWHHSGPGLSPL
jgi:galactokinase